MSDSLKIVIDKHCKLSESNPALHTPSLNPGTSYQFVMDELVAMDNDHLQEVFPGLQDECMDVVSQRGQLQNDLVNTMATEWKESNKDNQHNDVQQLLCLSDFKPESTNFNAGTAPSKATRSKGPKKSTDNLPVELIPDAKQMVKRQYRKYTETQVNDLFRLVFKEHKFASEAAREVGIAVRTGVKYRFL
ncbi:hypothetical protein BC941DRAFT_477462 [Chlamydoabsidia padenii]|nr:hypothetical protein BC941DRAFT_477462 [Chlamydoabsidia padenii]